MDIERLKNDPDYWNDVAPDEATHCNPDPNSDFRWYNEEKQSAMDREGGRWMDSQSSDFYWASLIPRPASKPWSGPEDGLPPVGADCLMDNARRGWAKVKIIAERDGYLFGWCSEETQVYFSNDPDDFRPLRTEKERVVEWALSQDCQPHEGMLSRADFCAKLYDLGALKMPEEP
jgi:hypothetical protein|tara:strand:+ start:472 stop:996 length:525 start_codon:yes stop_codon:yes gene_type:complete